MSTTAVPTSPALATRLRSGWVWALIALGLVLVVALTTERTDKGSLSPDSPSPNGTKALVQVLRQQGVEVERVKGLDELRRISESSEAGSTALVMFPREDGSEDADSLPGDVRERFGAVTLVGMPAHSLNDMGFEVTDGWSSEDETPARCSSPVIGKARTVSSPDKRYVHHGSPGWAKCFGNLSSGHLVMIREDDGHRLTLVSSGQWLTNGGISKADNAALALRLLGSHHKLVWYVAEAEEGGGSSVWGGRTMDALPPWTPHVLDLLLATAVVTMFWRGRRLGRLVAEPLPVEVKSLETTLNRGRLYRKAADPVHASAVLQRATVHRLAQRMGLPSSEVDELARRLVASYPVGELDHVHQLLTRPAVSGVELVWLAGELSDLEKIVRSE